MAIVSGRTRAAVSTLQNQARDCDFEYAYMCVTSCRGVFWTSAHAVRIASDADVYGCCIVTMFFISEIPSACMTAYPAG